MTKLLYNLLFPFYINSLLSDKVRTCWRCYLLPILLDPKQHFSRRIFTCYVYHSIPFPPPTHIQGIQLWRPFTLFTAWKAWMVCRLSSHLDGDMEESNGGGGDQETFSIPCPHIFFLSSNLFYKCWNCIYYVIFGPFKRDSVKKVHLKKSSATFWRVKFE